MNMTAAQLASQISGWLVTFVRLLLLALIVVAVAQHFGLRISALPTLGATELAYLSGAFWLVK